MKQLHKTSSGNGHPYRKISFWRNPVNHFWETDFYSPASKEYYRAWVQDMIREERRDYMISQ